MATNSVGELTVSLCAGSTDYAPGMTNIFLFSKIKSGQDLGVLIYNSALSLNRRIKTENKSLKHTLVLINILCPPRSYSMHH